uniref:Uncharacterized protein n=1 Tax=Leersia perrieri TaxID=77586 RepID=A0A0D9VXD9_9ORYZ
MDRLDPQTMVLDLGGLGKLPVTSHAVHCVLNLQNGQVDPPLPSEAADLDSVRNIVGSYDKGRIKPTHILSWIEKGGTDDFTMRCILMIIFAKLLAPDSSNNISKQDVTFANMPLNDYKQMDLCKLVVDYVRISAQSWRTGKKSTIQGCTIFPVVYFLDNLQWDGMITRTAIPCAQFFDSKLVNELENMARMKSNDGTTTYDKLHLRKFENTCYCVSEGKKAASASKNTKK